MVDLLSRIHAAEQEIAERTEELTSNQTAFFRVRGLSLNSDPPFVLLDLMRALERLSFLCFLMFLSELLRLRGESLDWPVFRLEIGWQLLDFLQFVCSRCTVFDDYRLKFVLLKAETMS